MNTVLVIGERPDNAKALCEMLGLMGVDALPSVREWKLAVRSLTSYQIDVVVIDISPGAESRKFFTVLKELTDVPMVVRAAEANGDEAVWYLDNGATDYLPQKMAPAVLAAKLKSLSKTIHAGVERRPLTLGDLEINLEARSVTRGGRDIALTPLEFRLLATLAENAGKPLKRKDLLARVWGDDFRECAHYLRLYIGYLRQKLEDDPHRPRLILTEWGHGYRLAAGAPAAASAERKRNSGLPAAQRISG